MEIKEILVKQKNELKYLKSLKIVEREKKVNVDQNIIKVITGPRRAGKSTFAISLLRDKYFAYVNFDEREITQFNSLDIEKGIKYVYGDTKYIFLDEIQNYKGWELWVNSLYRRGYNIIITGSNSNLLSKELSTHLTGRYLEIELLPFSFREVLKYSNFDMDLLDYDKEKQGLLLNLLEKYLQIGGFPEIWVKNLDSLYLKTLFENIIYKDVVKRWNIKYPYLMENLAKYLINNFSSITSITKLKNILNFKSVETLEKYIKYLEEAYLIQPLNNFSYKLKEVIRSQKKFYVIDNGLINTISYKFSNNFGRLMENLVFVELKRRYSEIFYLKTKENYEVDFVVKERNRISKLIQVTYANSFDEINPREYRSLLHANELFKSDKPELIMIT